MDKPYGEEKTQGPMPDFETLSHNMARFVEGAGKAAAAYLKPVQEGQAGPELSNDASEAIKSLSRVAEAWMSDPQRSFEAQSRLGTQFMSLWASTLKRAQGEPVEPVAEPEPKDNRFKDPEWSENPIFDFLKQAYLISSRWAEDLVEDAEGLDERTRHKAQFYLKQLSSALSPSNFLLTNPELIRETLRENGANLVRGMTMLAEDIEAGGGELKIRQSDTSKFKVGVNIATTPGKVIFRNDLIELIQYAPTTEKVLKRPLLIVPPWINKFYILDLNPEKSFVRWAVAQGLTVFCISWVNPAEQHAEKGFEHYMVDGIFAALDAIEQATGEKKVTAIGYCVGGTLLATTLAYMAAKRDKRIDSATFFTAQVDFTHAGDLKVFAGEEEVRSLEATMKKRGYLEGSRMANAFNMLRPNDLIWPYVVNVYMKGQSPFPFDLLYWNADSTRMPAANHAFYLRNCYLENRLAKGEMELSGVKLDLKKVKVPIFNLATKEDHIAPARSVFAGSKAFGGPVDYVLAGSGHIAGVVNSPSKAKYQFWTGGPVEGEMEDWLKQAKETTGTWWPYWFDWIKAQAPRMVPAREPGGGKLEPLCDAPGTYVLEKS
ncbi:class I poly(R)-hydroxyalkanoic acid synthase [Microvirga terrae]|uniref:Class I poly(R)-hydroxyalkanoic acid synthase n=1 Tax=Microvirga terrae TaxID=2740529 RepID=A0ABY5RKG1_9HYPH|nr:MULTISPECIES: class I poly(R)-hydroxyalkanoic acid synthase [Microvirga]MBQ0823056.1 class I poly(R)-hydroxyalkanoic acid synthase [Microvirga sp. HBU67558]UVF17705.1 class I poly(R)-hydroxyalkanoic acid synthase [Microvirga terrae]